MNIKNWLMNVFRGANAGECKIEVCDRACIAYNPQHKIFIRSYYMYCVGLVKQAVREAGARVNVIVGDYAVDFANGNRTVRVDIQHEHTLVKRGGRDTEGALPGAVVASPGDEHYLVRIEGFDYLRTLDIVIDYSYPNLVNIKESARFDDYLARTTCISPLLYTMDFGRTNRLREIVTLFADTRQPRRRQFLQQAKKAGLPLTNVKGVYGCEDLKRIYRDTRVLVNVHQTDHHHTFEELRVLPALQCGVVIVSEDVPLKEHIPYSKFIVWCAYKDIVATALSVHQHCEQYHRRIFDSAELVTVLNAMQLDNAQNMRTAVRKLSLQ